MKNFFLFILVYSDHKEQLCPAVKFCALEFILRIVANVWRGRILLRENRRERYLSGGRRDSDHTFISFKCLIKILFSSVRM